VKQQGHSQAGPPGFFSIGSNKVIIETHEEPKKMTIMERFAML
jgi:hypothetical protein